MRAFVALLLLAAGCPAVGADWKKLIETADRTYYIDSSQIQKKDGTAKVWTIQDLKKASAGGALSRKAQQEFDCTESKDRVLSIAEYAGPTGTGVRLFLDDKQRSWRPTTAGTVNSLIRRLVCKAAV